MNTLVDKCIRSAGGAGAELNANFWFRFETGLLHALDQVYPVIHRDGDESGGNFDGVEADLSAFVDVSIDLAAIAGQHALNESTRGDLNIESVGDIDPFLP